jgi:glycosyltransferase involved in cell wall biosynthesis
VGWIPFALRKGLSLCRREKIDLIFSSSPPPSAHLTASIIKHTTGIPWVADFRDPWIGYKLEKTPTPLHRFFRRKLKKAIVAGADRVVAANPVIQEELANEHGRLSKFYLLDQGYDEEDFQDYRWNKPDKFTLGYLGTFSPDCNPEPVFRALGELIRLNLVPKEEVRLLHVGGCVQVDLKSLAQKHGLGEVVRTTGYLSHKEALSRMQDASVLLLITCDDPKVFPAKIFEYLRLGTPLLGLVPPESKMAEFLQEMQAEAVIAPEDGEGIKQALISCFNGFKNGRLHVASKQDSLKGFERKTLTGRLASLFDEVISE